MKAEEDMFIRFMGNADAGPDYTEMLSTFVTRETTITRVIHLMLDEPRH